MRHSALKSVLIVNLKSLPTWHVDLAAGFAQCGVSADIFLTQPQTVAERLEKSLRGVKWSDSKLVLKRLVAQARANRPDMILFLGLLVLPRSALEALERGLDYRPLYSSWVCDCFREPQFDDWVQADHVFYFDTFLKSVLPQFYPDHSTWTFLPLAVDPTRYFPVPDMTGSDPALAFVGNVSANRAALIAALQTHIPVTVHGPNSSGRRFNRRRKLTSATINRIYNQHQLVLNINQAPNTENGANLRTFEVTAAGACLLTQASADLPLHYELNKEVLAYTDSDSLIEQYQRGQNDRAYLAAVAAAGHRRACAEHTFKHRAQSILATLA